MTPQDEILKYLHESPHTTRDIVAHVGRDTLEALRILELAKKVVYVTSTGLWCIND